VQDVHNLPIREVFIFPEQNNFAKIDWQLLNRRMHLLGLQFAYVMVVRVFGWLDDVVGSVIPGIDLNDLGAVAQFSQLVDSNIFQNGEQPAFDVAVGAQFPHGLRGASVGFLYQVYGFGVVASQAQGVAAQSVEVFDTHRAGLDCSGMVPRHSCSPSAENFGLDRIISERRRGTLTAFQHRYRFVFASSLPRVWKGSDILCEVSVDFL
jgi:hypothetical protein